MSIGTDHTMYAIEVSMLRTTLYSVFTDPGPNFLPDQNFPDTPIK